MQDVLSSSVGLFRFIVVAVIVVGIASAIGNFSYFSNSFAWGQATAALSMVDYIVLFITAGFFTLSVGLAALSRNNRVFLPVSIIFLVITVFISAIFTDVYLKLVGSTALLSSAANSLTILNLVASNIPVVIGVMGLIVIIATYSSIGGGQRAAR